MKKLIGILVAVFLIAMMLPASLGAETSCPGTWTVNIGDPVSETQPGITISGWGIIRGSDSGSGNYGGIDNCRCMWEAPTPSESLRCADVTYTCEECVWPTYLEWSSLDGQATDDGYEVYVDGVLVYTYLDQVTPETWFPQAVDLTPFQLPNMQAHVVEFCATGVAWTDFSSWGQVAIDYVTLTTEPCQGEEGNVDLDATVIENACICLTVSPSGLDFGELLQGSTSDEETITLTNCGDVDIVVTADAHGAFYEANLEFKASPWESAEGWTSPEITVGNSLIVKARVKVPSGCPAGDYGGSVSFIASEAP